MCVGGHALVAAAVGRVRLEYEQCEGVAFVELFDARARGGHVDRLVILVPGNERRRIADRSRLKLDRMAALHRDVPQIHKYARRQIIHVHFQNVHKNHLEKKR